ncbi:membrane protein [Catellatospora sp. IY07-71]|uniref:glycosyltransferase family 39 protein n=1 Tax=Catellatospora sp. IY07-71 TaxID=2728827 RepID=UPI001BB40A54|nr:glycosyltransferase family 39 protein [Catellatospora sp. IY07-71]BCJ70561.1 membrane protein [Catellatospora sp. IY07-71]
METLPSIDARPADSASALRPVVVAAAPALLMLVVGAVGMTGRQVWQDELATWWASTISWAEFRELLGHNDVVLAPYYLFMRVWVGAFGDSALALRTPALLAMAAAAAMTASLGRRLFGARIGLIAGIVFALLPGITRYAQEARPYALVLAGVTGSALLLLRAVEHPGRARWTAYAATGALTTALHPLALPFLPAHAAWAWRRGRARAFLPAGAVAAAPALASLWAARGQTGQVSWIDTAWWALFSVLGELLFSYLLPLFVVAAVVAAIVRRRRTEPDAVWLLAVWSWAPILLLYALRPVQDLFVHRYLLYVLPAWAVLAAVTLADLHGATTRRRSPGTARVVGTAGLALLAALALPGHRDARADPAWQPDLRALAEVVAARQEPGDAIVFGGSSWNERLSLRYHLRGAPAPRDAFLALPESRGTYAAAECGQACLGEPPRIWLIVVAGTDDPLAGLPPEKAGPVRDGYTVVETFRARLVRLVLLARRT